MQMKKADFTRRKFIATVSAGSVAAMASGAIPVIGNTTSNADKLAVMGGERLRKKPFTTWPQSSNKLEEMLVETAKSGKWCRLDGGSKTVNTFEKKFADLIGTKVLPGNGFRHSVPAHGFVCYRC